MNPPPPRYSSRRPTGSTSRPPESLALFWGRVECFIAVQDGPALSQAEGDLVYSSNGSGQRGRDKWEEKADKLEDTEGPLFQ